MAEYDIRKIQLVELDILKEFDRVCKKNDLTYFLDSGTALGAVRHGGFIPWDDDIDVGMPRKDYDRFLKIAKDELSSVYFLQTLETDPKCPVLFAKIRRNGTTYQENNKVGMKMHMGIWIDIFPFDYISPNTDEQKAVIQKVLRYKNLFMLKKIPHIYSNTGESKLIHTVRSFIRKCIHVALQVMPDAYFVDGINKAIFDQKNNTENVTCFYYGRPIVWKTKGLLPTETTFFEGSEFSCVKDQDYYLKVQYGNYMKLPPVEQRQGHRSLYVDYGDIELV